MSEVTPVETTTLAPRCQRQAASAHTPLRMRIAGVEADAVTVDDLLALPRLAKERGHRSIIAHHNVHSVFLARRDPIMRAFYARAHLTFIDGMPLVWMARLLGHKVGRQHRMTSVDWIIPLLAVCADQGLRVFLLGSRPDVVTRAAEAFIERVPHLRVAYHHGYFDTRAGSAGTHRVLSAINDFGADILLVGMGMPLQEHWIVNNVEDLRVRMVWSLGAFMDYYAGAIPTPPRWLGPLGLEWLYRLGSEPRRLWRRYLLEPWVVLRLFLAEYRKERVRLPDHS